MFQHWACSRRCAQEVEVPARAEQLVSAKEQDRQYERYVRESISRLKPSQRLVGGQRKPTNHADAMSTISDLFCFQDAVVWQSWHQQYSRESSQPGFPAGTAEHFLRHFVIFLRAIVISSISEDL